MEAAAKDEVVGMERRELSVPCRPPRCRTILFPPCGAWPSGGTGLGPMWGTPTPRAVPQAPRPLAAAQGSTLIGGQGACQGGGGWASFVLAAAAAPCAGGDPGLGSPRGLGSSHSLSPGETPGR